MTDRFTFDAGPYVLGALPPEERHAFEEHLDSCAACQAEVREFAGLPGLLSRLPAGELPAALEGEPEPSSPVSVLPSLLRAAGVQRTSRRRRTLLAGVAAALVVAAGSAVVTDTIVHRSAPAAVLQDTALAFTPASPLPIAAAATITDVPGGTQIAMTCRYTGSVDGDAHEYRLRLIPKGGGKPQWLGSWPVWSTDTYKMTIFVPVARDRIGSLEVVTADGQPLSTLSLS
jgi:putative zinc finger protein